MTGLKALLLGATLLTMPVLAIAATPLKSSVYGAPESVGTVNLSDLASGNGGGGPAPDVASLGASGSRAASARSPAARTQEWRVMPSHARPLFLGGPRTDAASGEALAAAPLVSSLATTPVVSSVLFGFNGIDHYDQRILADNGNQFSLEPPDQALAVGNGFVLEVVNNALQVYDTSGNPLLAAPVSTNRFFNQVSEINRGYENQRGPSLSDPRAYYDSDMQRFIVVEWATLNDAAGNPLNISVQFLAVSETSDPTGTYRVYSYETTNADVANCPCFPDFQQIGVDKHGLYITANLFGIASGNFAGAKIYAISKSALANGTPATIVEFAALPNNFTIHPTVVPPGGAFSGAEGGTEYLVESQADTTNSGRATAVNVWAISNTSSLSKATPSLTLASVASATQDYGNASPTEGLPPAVQPDGPRPLGGSGTGGLNQPVPLLNADDARFSSTPVFVNGRIWAVLGSAVVGAQYSYSAIDWFDFRVSGGATTLKASTAKEGQVVAAPGTSLLYPAVAMPTGGLGGIGVTVSGPSNYPSTAVISLSSAGSTGSIVLSGIAVLPDDGFTAYPTYGGKGVGRWGDYGAAAVDETGGLWFGNEYIPNTATYPRSTLANWGTYITNYTP